MTEVLPTSRFLLGRTRIELDHLAAHRGGVTVPLTPTEAALLQHLLDAGGASVSRQELLTSVWGYRPDTRTRTLTTTLSRLRKKVEPDPSHPAHLLTVRGEGIQLVGAETVAARRPREHHLFGREEAVRQTLERLDEHRLVCITGPVGVGKSAVAREVVARWQGDALRLDAHEQHHVDDLVARLAVQLDRRLERGMAGLLEVLAELDAPLLLIDGLKAMQGVALEALLERTHLLITGPPTGLAAERVVRLAPLAREASRQLVEEELDRQGLTLPADTLDAFLRRAGGLPRDLLLLAPTVGLFGLDGPEVGDIALETPIRSALNRLDPARRDRLAELALFHGGFGVDAAIAVMGYSPPEALAHVRLLVDRGLLTLDHHVLGMLPAVRALLPSPSREARERWVGWLRTLRNSSLLDLGALAGRHLVDLRHALRSAPDAETAEDLAWPLYDHRALHAPGTEPDLLDAIARFDTDTLHLLELGIRHADRAAPRPADVERVDALAARGDLFAQMLRNVWLYQRPGLLSPEAPSDPAVAARFLPGALVSADPDTWLEQTDRVRRDARIRGWKTVLDFFQLSFAWSLACGGRSEQALGELSGIELESLPGRLRMQFVLTRGVIDFVSGHPDAAIDVLERLPAARSPHANEVLRLVCWWSGRPLPRYRPSGNPSPLRLQAEAAFARLRAGEPARTGDPEIDGPLFDAPGNATLPALVLAVRHAEATPRPVDLQGRPSSRHTPDLPESP